MGVAAAYDSLRSGSMKPGRFAPGQRRHRWRLERGRQMGCGAGSSPQHGADAPAAIDPGPGPEVPAGATHNCPKPLRCGVARRLQPVECMRLVLALVLAIVGCGADRDDSSGAGNALGKQCTTATDCPSAPPHECVFLESGNPTLGYCSPMCTVDDDCRAGYAGPASGSPYCLVPNQSGTCSISCTQTADCPAELECVVVEGRPFNFCTTR
jgi:hypothetical protein